MHCQKHTNVFEPRIVSNETKKLGNIYSVKARCATCQKIKSRRLGRDLPSGYTLESTEEELQKLITSLPTANKQIRSGSALDSETAATISAITESAGDDVDGEGFWDSIKNIGRKKTMADKIGDAASKFTKSAVRSIPIVGDILADSGIVDSGIDWISENIWQPIKKTFGWALDDALKEKLKNDDTAIQDILEKMYEIKIKTGDGLVPKYIGELRHGTDEDKTLAHVLLKTLCKPKFYKFLKDEQVPSTMSILEAYTKYKSKPKTYRNQEEKAQQILSSLGYNFT